MSSTVPCTGNCGVSYHVAGSESARLCASKGSSSSVKSDLPQTPSMSTSSMDQSVMEDTAEMVYADEDGYHTSQDFAIEGDPEKEVSKWTNFVSKEAKAPSLTTSVAEGDYGPEVKISTKDPEEMSRVLAVYNGLDMKSIDHSKIAQLIRE